MCVCCVHMYVPMLYMYVSVACMHCVSMCVFLCMCVCVCVCVCVGSFIPDSIGIFLAQVCHVC